MIYIFVMSQGILSTISTDVQVRLTLTHESGQRTVTKAGLEKKHEIARKSPKRGTHDL